MDQMQEIDYKPTLGSTFFATKGSSRPVTSSSTES